MLDARYLKLETKRESDLKVHANRLEFTPGEVEGLFE